MMNDLFKYDSNDPRSTQCRAVKYMNEHNRRAEDAANRRKARIEEIRKEYAIQIVQPSEQSSLFAAPGWLKNVVERARQTNGNFRLFSFRLRFGRLLVELQRADGTLAGGRDE